MNAHREQWFDADIYPDFSTPIQLVFERKDGSQIRTVSFGKAGMAMELTIHGKKPTDLGAFLKLYNTTGSSKFPNFEKQFEKLCLIISKDYARDQCQI
jgi:hypothetical protein